jgi:hypothetical protein
MKIKLLLTALIASIALSFSASAQVVPRGNYGTVQPWTPSTGGIYKQVGAVPTPVAADTLVNVDTGYVYFTFNNLYNHLIVLHIVPVTGTGAGTSILQGSYDNTTWYTLTGNTTYCTTCKGASATIANAVADYTWNLPVDVGANFKFTRIRTISSGTVTETYTAIDYYGY